MQIPNGFSLAESRSGHAHFHRGNMSRRSFIGRVTAGAAVITSPFWKPTLLSAAASDPTPIPQTVAPGLPFHVVLPGMGEPSSINNFRGVVGAASIGGQGTGINTDTGETERLLFDVDNRFMKGTYVGAGGHTYEATFAFV
jgi:hypothetical protein